MSKLMSKQEFVGIEQEFVATEQEFNKRKLDNMLDKLQIRIDVLGYRYWTTAVELYMADPTYKLLDLYSRIAKIHYTSISKVDRCMRTCFNPNKVKRFFNIKYNITVKTLLELLCREMNRN